MQSISRTIFQPRAVTRSAAAAALSALVLAVTLPGCARDDGKVQPPAAPAPAQTASPPAATPPAASEALSPASADGPITIVLGLGDDEREQAWMQTIFQDAYDPERRSALVRLKMDGDDLPHLMTLDSASKLLDGRIALVVNGTPADEEGKQSTGRGSSGILNVYLLRPQAGGWALDARREHLSEMGSDGQIGAVAWIALGPGKPGFTVSSYYTGQGYSSSAVELFELGNGIRKVGALTEASDNSGACSSETEKCWDIRGALHWPAAVGPNGYADLEVDFHGRRYRYSKDDTGMTTEVPLKTIRQSARYRFDGKTYALVSGANPIDED